jgi:predicted dehydrogenase
MRYNIQHNGTAEYNELEWHGTQPAMNENPDRTFKYDEAIGDGGYTPLIRATLRAALGETTAPITGAEGLEALRVIFAAYESAHTNRTITLH